VGANGVFIMPVSFQSRSAAGRSSTRRPLVIPVVHRR
jgi:hypothetical protein